MEKEIMRANYAELMEEKRPTAAQRRRDLEAELGSFEDCLMEALGLQQ